MQWKDFAFYLWGFRGHMAHWTSNILYFQPQKRTRNIYLKWKFDISDKVIFTQCSRTNISFQIAIKTETLAHLPQKHLNTSHRHANSVTLHYLSILCIVLNNIGLYGYQNPWFFSRNLRSLLWIILLLYPTQSKLRTKFNRAPQQVNHKLLKTPAIQHETHKLLCI